VALLPSKVPLHTLGLPGNNPVAGLRSEGKGVNPLQAQEALSATRIAMAIQDIPQTISVVPGELIQDTMSFKMSDAAKYVTPVS